MQQQLLLLLTSLPYYLLSISILSLVFAFLLTYLKFRILKQQSKVAQTLFEITPPYDTKQSSYSTEQLYSTLFTLRRTVSLKETLLGIKQIYSLEIVSTGKGGIRFLLRVNKNDSETLKKNLYSFLPGVEIKEVKDYLPNTFDQFTNHPYQLHELTLKNHFVYPLQTQAALKEYDPIAYITGHMTKLKDNECIALQVLLTPVTQASHRRETSLIKTIQWHLLHGRDISSFLRRKSILNKGSIITTTILFVTAFSLYSYLLVDIQKLLPILVLGFFAFLWWYLGYNPKSSKNLTRLSSEQSDIYGKVGEKLGNTLFETTIRIYVLEDTPGTLSHRLSGLIASITSSTQTPYQSLKIKREALFSRKIAPFEKYSYLLLKNRFLSLHNNPILSSSEIGSIYHFPFTPTTKTEDMSLVKSPVLPLPLSLKTNREQFSITFAKNIYGNTELPIGLLKEERARHMYILGATGTGKSTLLLNLIQQDIVKGNGLCVIDPHGDLTQAILPKIPKNRVKDVVYFNPSDRDFPIGINLLEKTEGLSKDKEEMEKDMIASSVVSVFSKLYPKRFWGPRMEYFLRNSALTALETEDPSLITIHKLLLDNNYRKTVVDTLKDPLLKMFWQKEFARLGSYQKAEAIAPITNKIGRFLTSPLTRLILGQTKSKLNLTDIMDNKKILLCDLSKGKIGEDTTTLLGALITAKIQLTAMRRAQVAENKRTDIYLYIDEFQNFTTDSFAQIMSEARKYHLFVILAHQTIAQIEDKDLIKVILANTGTLISFRTSSVSDEAFVLPNFAPEVKPGEVFNLPNHSFYMKLQAVTPQSTFSGETILLDKATKPHFVKEIITSSRKQFGFPRAEIEKEITKSLAYLEEDDKKKKRRKRKPKLPDDTSIINYAQQP